MITRIQRLLAFLTAMLCLTANTIAQIQKNTPLTPEAATLAKLGNFPISMNTGVPDIGIPFYTIDIGGMKLPIALRYHAGGFKLNEKSNNIGLGWSLGTDIQITRSINGTDDFGRNGYATTNTIPIYPFGWSNGGAAGTVNYDNNILYQLAAGATDGKPDKFNYKLLNKSGSFYILKNGNGYVFTTAPYDNIQITFNTHQFIITDSDGTKYYFSVPVPPANVTNLADAGREMAGDDIITWKCLKIVNPTGTDEITFTYSNMPEYTNVSEPDFIEYYFNNSICGTSSLFNQFKDPNHSFISGITDYTNLLDRVGGQFQLLSSPKYMEYINGRANKFHMLYKNSVTGPVLDRTFTATFSNQVMRSGRAVMKGLALQSINFRGGSVYFNGTDQVTSVSVSNNSKLVKTLTLFQTFKTPTDMSWAKYYNGNSFRGTMYLDSVHMSNGVNPFERYAFMYRRKFCFGDHLKGHDAWGYVSSKTMEIGAAQNFSLVPRQDITENNFPYFYVSPISCAPTNFRLDGNWHDEYPDAEYAQSGILKRILYPTGGFTDFDFELNAYHDNFSGTNQLLFAGGLRVQKITWYNGKDYTPVNQKYYTYGDMEDGGGTLLHSPVINRVNGQLIYGNYKFTQTVYYGYKNNDIYGIPGSEHFPPIYMDCNSAACITIEHQESKTTFLPNAALDLSYAGGPPVCYNKITEYQQDYGKRTGKVVYKYYPPKHFMQDVFAIPDLSIAFIPNTDEKYLRENWFMNKLQSVTEYKFEANKFVFVHQKEYDYQRLLQSQWPRAVSSFLRSLYNLRGTNMQTYEMYVLNVSQTGDFTTTQTGIPIGNLLLSKETEKWRNEVTGDIITTSNQYLYENPNYVQPTKIRVSDGKGGIRTRQLKYPYDFPGDPIYAAMVAKNMLTPVIESIELDNNNYELSRIRHDYALFNNAFHAVSRVRESLQGNTLEMENSFDLYDQYANLLQNTSRSGLVSSCIWGYNGVYPVAMVEGLNYATISPVVNMAIVNAPASESLLKTELNKIRSIPSPGLATTYTYDPLVGVTSITDAKGKSTSFLYDEFNRLIAVKDQESRILKKHQYSSPILSQMPEFYTNRPVFGTAKTCFVGPGIIVGDPYVVAGGSITALDKNFADAQAINQMQTNVSVGSETMFCADASKTATLNLQTNFFANTPDIFIDLFQNGELVASYKYGNANTTTMKAYLPEGTYQLNFRYNAAYREKAFLYYVNSSDGSIPYSQIQTGATIQLKGNVTYMALVMNSY